MPRLMLAALLVLPLLGSDAPRDYDGATVRKDELEGTWRLVAVRADAGPPAVEVKGTGRLTFRRGRWGSIVAYTIPRSGTYEADPARGRLDMAPESGGATA